MEEVARARCDVPGAACDVRWSPINLKALMNMSDKPKSSLELVMERLRKKDADAGIEEKPLTDQQREAIAEARSVHESKVAERRIMHQSAINSVFDPAELAERESELRRDLESFASERDAKIKRIRET